jgi:alkylation response protein AidB-like acyl-CoA dehydrogenase
MYRVRVSLPYPRRGITKAFIAAPAPIEVRVVMRVTCWGACISGQLLPPSEVCSMATSATASTSVMLTLPTDSIRQIQWRFADRYDLQMLAQSARAVARGTVAHMVAAGERNSHEWTPAKNEMLEAFDRAGITAAFMEPEEGGFISGPKNLALALAAFELAWVDGGAATASLAGFLALAPIHERGTPEQSRHYKALSAPPQPGEDRKPWRGAFVLTEPIPYVGVDTGMLSGKLRIAGWRDGEEPWLQVEKRGRFITNIAFANFVTAAVTSDDPHIKGSCVVILEETDEGTFDHGTPTKKLVHQLSSTGDPIFNLRVPASRIVGGYTIKDNVAGSAAPRAQGRGRCATNKASSSAKTRFIGSSMSVQRAKQQRPWGSPRHGSSMSSTQLKNRRMPSWQSVASSMGAPRSRPFARPDGARLSC